MEQKRETYYDVLRGCAILFVVAIHTFGLSFSNGSFPLPSICFRNVLNIAVPVFLALSGFFMAHKWVERSNFAPFFKKHFFRVYLPVLFCSIPLLLENVLGGGSVMKNMLCLVFCGYSIYYFVAVIIQCYLLLPFLNYMYNKGRNAFFLVIICSLVLAVCSWAVKSYVLPKYEISLPLIAYAGGFWMWSTFFIFGYYLGRQMERVYSIKPWILLSFMSFILCVIESVFLDKSGYGIGVGQKPSAMFFSFCMIPLLLSKKTKGSFDKFNGKLKDFLGSVGFYSFGIYLIHCYVLVIYHIAVKKNVTHSCEWVFAMGLSDRSYFNDFLCFSLGNEKVFSAVD